MNILLTGATGFVGSALLERFQRDGHHVGISLRNAKPNDSRRPHQFVVGDMGPSTSWVKALQGRDVVVHCAARVHVMKEHALKPLAAFREVNCQGTLNLAAQAADAGVRRFVYISSIGVNGAETLGLSFTAEDVPAPCSMYAVSKFEAEVGLRQIAQQAGMEVVIVRPPLIYGPNAPGNFSTLVSFLRRGWPLPLGAVGNRRSYVSLDNLTDLLATCLTHPGAANQTFLVSDGADISTTDLLIQMGRALGRPARLLPVPSWLLTLGAKLLGKPEMAQRLCGSLQIDISKTRDALGWTPPLSVAEGLRKAAEGYLSEARV